MKKITKWIELIFIFGIPLLLLILCIQFKTINTYDENNNVLTSEKVLDISEDTILREYNNNLHYKNKLILNQNLDGEFNSEIWNTFNADITIEENYTILEFSGNNDFQFYTYKNLNLQHKYLILMKVSSNNNSVVNCRFGLNNFKSFNLNSNEISYIYNIANPTENNTEINFYVYYLQNEPTTIFNFYWGELIDLTEMYGEGYEPTTINDLYFDYTKYYQNETNEEIIVETNNIISNNYEINYTWHTKIFNELYNTLQIENNTILKIITTYTILWLVMFIIWHIFYLPFNKLLHIFEKD